MREFHLELHPDKTRLLEFGPYAMDNRKRRGEGKPETFNFLGFSVLQKHTDKEFIMN
jgi:RNA-directed DNA polymerase